MVSELGNVDRLSRTRAKDGVAPTTVEITAGFRRVQAFRVHSFSV
jgi:hypothetical protein